MKHFLFLAILFLIGIKAYSIDSVLELKADNVNITALPSNEVIFDNNGDPMAKVIIGSDIDGLSFDGNVYKQEKTINGYELWIMGGTKRLVIRHPNYLTGNVKLPFSTKGGSLIKNIEIVANEQPINIANLSELRKGEIVKVYVIADPYAELFIDGTKVSSTSEFFYLYPGIHVFETITPLGKYAQTVRVEKTNDIGVIDVHNAALVRLAITPSHNNYSMTFFGQKESKDHPYIGIMSDTSDPMEYVDYILQPKKTPKNNYFIPLQAIQYTGYSGYTLPRIYSTLYSNSKSLNEIKLTPRDVVELDVQNSSWVVKNKEKMPVLTSFNVISETADYDSVDIPFDFNISNALYAEDKSFGEQWVKVAIIGNDWADLYIDGQKRIVEGGALIASASPGVHELEARFRDTKYSVSVDVQQCNPVQKIDMLLSGEIWIYKPTKSKGIVDLYLTDESTKPQYVVQTESSYDYTIQTPYGPRNQTMKCDLIMFSGLLGTYIIEGAGTLHENYDEIVVDVKPRERTIIYAVPADNGRSVIKIVGREVQQIPNETIGLQDAQIH